MLVVMKNDATGEQIDRVVSTIEAMGYQARPMPGVRMAIVSNWDNSLHRTLRMFGLTEYFEHVVASLEEGVEKPEARIFQIALERAGVEPGDALHVGDNPIDDWQGAKNVGMRALLQI